MKALRAMIRLPRAGTRGAVGYASKSLVAPVLAAILILTGESAVIAGPLALYRYDDIAIDRSGKHVVSIEGSVPENVSAIPNPRIVIRPLTGSGERIVAACDGCRYTGVTVSPAGETTYLIRNAAGATEIVIEGAAGTRRLATIDGNAAAPQWSPDGTQLALLVTLSPRKETGPTQAGARMIGEIGVNEDRQRLALIDVGTGALRFVSPAEMFVFEADWLPNGSGLAGIAVNGDGDNDWYISKLYAFDSAGGAPRVIASPERQIMRARVSADGKSVGFISGLMSDYNQGGGDVFVVPMAGGAARNITPGAEASFTNIAWQGNALVAAGVKLDAMTIVSIDSSTGRESLLWSTTDTVNVPGTRNGVAFAANGKVAAGIRERFEAGPELLAGPVGAPRVVTRSNASLPVIASGRSLSWQNDGQVVQGWLVSAASARKPVAKQPMIVVVHGGPAGYGGPEFIWQGWRKALIEKGYALFFPNPRGSAGRGETFKRANILDLGGGDLRDIMAGIDHVVKDGAIDPERIGITGFSYGGFMSMWAVTQTNRFKAAAAGASVANWVSYYGQNGIDKWLLPYFGGASPYSNPQPYHAAAPISFVKNVRTPTFIYVGERDIETPPVQSREFWKALRELDVPTTLMVYADEGHRLRNPENMVDADRRIVNWFERYVAGKPAE